jgi:hypothetical protein
VARRRYDFDGPVTEHVMVAVELGRRVFRLEATYSERIRPIVLCTLHEQHRSRKQFDIADVIGMRVGDRNELDALRFDAELVQLRGERRRLAPAHGSRISGRLPVRHRCDRVRHSGVP